MPVLDDVRQEKFAELMAQGIKRDKAYAEAGFKPDGRHAFRMVRRPHVAARIKELMEQAAKHAVVTQVGLIQEFGKLAERANKMGQMSAAVAARIAQAKLAGLWIDRAEVNSNVHYAISDEPMSDEEWRLKYCKPDPFRENPATAGLVIDAKADPVEQWKQRFANESKLLNHEPTSKN